MEMFGPSDTSGSDAEDLQIPPPRVRRGSVYIGHIPQGKEPQGMWIGCYHIIASVLLYC